MLNNVAMPTFHKRKERIDELFHEGKAFLGRFSSFQLLRKMGKRGPFPSYLNQLLI